MTGVTRQRCVEDGWSAAVTACFVRATADDAQQACALQMRADQHRRWYLQLMTGEVPGERLAAAPAAPDPQPTFDRSLAQAWVARILFERCIVDNWPEPARSCFAVAAVRNTCDELLPEAAHTALNDHLVDMAESLGVPH